MQSIRPLGIPLAAMLIIVLVPGASRAQAILVASQPANGAVLAQAPSVATLTFDAPVRVVAVTLQGSDRPETPLTLASAAGDDTPGGTAISISITVPLPSLPPGNYRIAWRAMSRDADPMSGTTGFTVLNPPGGDATGGPAAPAAR